MWCAHTRNPSTAMLIEASATKEYPNTRLREKHATTSLTTPMLGRIMM